MTEMVIEIIVELLFVLALATKHNNQGRFSMSVLPYNPSHDLPVAEKYAKKVFWRKGRPVLLKIHSRLEESKTTVAQTLDVVCGGTAWSMTCRW
jgi:hypothetical protein